MAFGYIDYYWDHIQFLCVITHISHVRGVVQALRQLTRLTVQSKLNKHTLGKGLKSQWRLGGVVLAALLPLVAFTKIKPSSTREVRLGK